MVCLIFSFDLKLVLEVQTSHPYIFEVRFGSYFLGKLAYLVLRDLVLLEKRVALDFRTSVEIGLEIANTLLML